MCMKYKVKDMFLVDFCLPCPCFAPSIPPLILPHNINVLSPSSQPPNLSFIHLNALFCMILVLGPSMAARCLFMDCTNDRNDKGEGSQWLMKWGRIIKQNSLHLEKLVLCGGLLFWSFMLEKTTRRAPISKADMCTLMAGSLSKKNKKQNMKSVIRVWMSQSCKRMGYPPTESLLTRQLWPRRRLGHVICIICIQKNNSRQPQHLPMGYIYFLPQQQTRKKLQQQISSNRGWTPGYKVTAHL